MVACVACSLVEAVDSFPAFPMQRAGISIIEPVDGSFILASEEGKANITLRYHLAEAGTTRLCLDLRRDALSYGPTLKRSHARTFAPYARGCYAVGQLVKLQNLGLGSYLLAASTESSTGGKLSTASTYFAITPRVENGLRRAVQSSDANHPPFEPTYEWAEVGREQSVPSGLEVKLTMHAVHKDEAGAPLSTDADANALGNESKGDPLQPRYARIPPTWRLQVYAGRGVGFLRHDVQRSMTLASVEAGLRMALPMSHAELSKWHCPPRVELWTSASSGARERLGPSTLSVEDAALFGRRHSLVAKLTPCTPEDESYAQATKDAASESHAAARLSPLSHDAQRTYHATLSHPEAGMPHLQGIKQAVSESEVGRLATDTTPLPLSLALPVPT